MAKRLFCLRKHQLPDQADGLTADEELVYYYLLWCIAYDAKPLPSRELGRSLGLTHPSHQTVLRIIGKLEQLGLATVMYEPAAPHGRWEVWRYPTSRPCRVLADALEPA